ncbi:MAG: glutamate racemase [Deltaproteobacteria bacterium]|nr:glutamate racemase [Deltaproteobacteria bacterium]
MSSKPIGIFDSGVGGLTVLAATRRLLPNESLVYLGDTARVPYGNKSAETILKYSEECCAFLASKNVKAIVIACNTASAHALPYLQHRFHFPIIGVIEPGVEEALRVSKNRHIGLIGTEATVRSEIYAKELKKRDSLATVSSQACPLFVPLVEEDWLDNEITRAVAQKYLTSFGESNIDTLILGCTHYPLLKKVIGELLGPQVSLIDSAEAIARKCLTLFGEGASLPAGRQAKVSGSFSPLEIYITDFSSRFESIAKRFLETTLPPIKKAVL